MKRAYIKPETDIFKTEMENMICQSPLTYETNPKVGSGDPVLSREFDFESEDLDFSFGLNEFNFPQQ
ncbi:MAG: hypothetical protein J6T38_02425 [Bacteroidaceae bacterium]|nr:hypothetical protein [Bacteroidaceae bacterium]